MSENVLRKPVDPEQTSPLETGRHRLSLFAILLLACLLRVSFLATIPNGFHADEASTGYDAFSILKTSRDQYGDLLPLFARSFGDYNETLYRYTAVPFISIFGLNEFATRLPAALAGILTVWVLYTLTTELFNPRVALVVALLLAISPWHIQFSRWAGRAILLPLLFCLGLYLFLRGLKRPGSILLSALTFAVCLHTYSSARVFVPLFILGLVLIFWRELWKVKKPAFISGALFLSVAAPLFYFWVSPEGMARARATLTTDPFSILPNTLSYFHPAFLFLSGDANPRHSLLNMGQLYHFEAIAAPAGIIALLRRKKKWTAWSGSGCFSTLFPRPLQIRGTPSGRLWAHRCLPFCPDTAVVWWRNSSGRRGQNGRFLPAPFRCW